MTQILHLRARRFHALHDLLTGESLPGSLSFDAVPEYLSRDVGLPERTLQDRHISDLGLPFFFGRSWGQRSPVGQSL